MLHIQELKMTREFQAFFPVEITAQRHKSHVLFVLFFLRQKKTQFFSVDTSSCLCTLIQMKMKMTSNVSLYSERKWRSSNEILRKTLAILSYTVYKHVYKHSRVYVGDITMTSKHSFTATFFCLQMSSSTPFSQSSQKLVRSSLRVLASN